MANNRTSTYGLVAVLLVVLLLLEACSGSNAIVVKETTTAEAEPSPTVTAILSPAPESEGDRIQIVPHSLAWAPSGHWLAYTSVDGRAWLRARESGTPAPVEGIHLVGPAELRVAWSPDGKYLLVYGEWDSPRWTGLWLVPARY